MFDRKPEEESKWRWAPIVAVVVAVHVLIGVLMLRAQAGTHAADAPAGDGAGLVGAVSGAAPVRAVRVIMCAYSLSADGLRLHHFDRGGHGEWAVCPPSIDTSGLGDPHPRNDAPSPGKPAAPPRPPYFVLAFDVDSAATVVSKDIVEDAGDDRFAMALQDRVAALHHATPSGMSRLSAPVSYSYRINFRKN